MYSAKNKWWQLLEGEGVKIGYKSGQIVPVRNMRKSEGFYFTDLQNYSLFYLANITFVIHGAIEMGSENELPLTIY